MTTARFHHVPTTTRTNERFRASESERGIANSAIWARGCSRYTRDRSAGSPEQRSRRWVFAPNSFSLLRVFSPFTFASPLFVRFFALFVRPPHRTSRALRAIARSLDRSFSLARSACSCVCGCAPAVSRSPCLLRLTCVRSLPYASLVVRRHHRSLSLPLSWLLHLASASSIEVAGSLACHTTRAPVQRHRPSHSSDSSSSLVPSIPWYVALLCGGASVLLSSILLSPAATRGVKFLRSASYCSCLLRRRRHCGAVS